MRGNIAITSKGENMRALLKLLVLVSIVVSAQFYLSESDTQPDKQECSFKVSDLDSDFTLVNYQAILVNEPMIIVPETKNITPAFMECLTGSCWKFQEPNSYG